jgi:hypothetical protein
MIAWGKMRNEYNILAGEPEGQCLLRTPKKKKLYDCLE